MPLLSHQQPLRNAHVVLCNTIPEGTENCVSNATVESSSFDFWASSQSRVHPQLTCQLTDCELESAASDWTQIFKLGVTDDNVVCYLAG